MNAPISSKTSAATAHAGRINFKSSSLLSLIAPTKSKPSAQTAFLQKAVVMPHHQMRFDLAHRIEQNAHSDQHARAAEKSRDVLVNGQLLRQNNRNHGNDGQKNRTGK